MSFPAEAGFESNALALQIHGGYGYSSEYLPEAWLRDQKLNSIHEGTTGIQGLDLLGRRAVAEQGAGLRLLLEEIGAAASRAREAGLDPAWPAAVEKAAARLAETTATLAGKGLSGDAEGMLLHSTDYLRAACILVVSWLWLRMASAAQAGLARDPASRPFYEGKLCAAQYWLATELPDMERLLALCRDGEDSYGRMRDEWF